MQAIITIITELKKAGRYTPGRHFHIKIENKPYMALVIEDIEEPGPAGYPTISVAHYGEQNGDLMRDPEMCFELIELPDGSMTMNAFYWRGDYAGIEEWSRYRQNDIPMTRSVTHAEHVTFAAQWSQNLIDQGFLEALESTLKELRT
jgi:hypothetical protein